MTMDKLPENVIGIYPQQLDTSGVRIPFSSFLLSVIRHFRVHFSQLVLIGLNRVTLFEIRCYSLNHAPTVSLFRVFYRLWERFFLRGPFVRRGPLPLAVDRPIPAKDHLMEKAERPDDDVIRAREKKEQDNARRAAMKRAGGEGTSAGTKRRKQTVLDLTAGQDDVISADPLNQANPSGVAGGGAGGNDAQEEEHVQEGGDDNDHDRGF